MSARTADSRAGPRSARLPLDDLAALAAPGRGRVGALFDAIADRQFWKSRGGTFISTPGFTGMARWLTLILGIPFLAVRASAEERAALASPARALTAREKRGPKRRK